MEDYVSAQCNGLERVRGKEEGREREEEERGGGFSYKQNEEPNFFQIIYDELVYESYASKSEHISSISEYSSTNLK